MYFDQRQTAVEAAEVLTFRDYGTHVVVVTKHGQKLTDADEQAHHERGSTHCSAGGLWRPAHWAAVDAAMREAAAPPKRDFRQLIDVVRAAIFEQINSGRPARAASVPAA